MSVARTASSIAASIKSSSVGSESPGPAARRLDLVGDDREHAQRPLVPPRALDLVLERPGGEPAAAAHLVRQGVSATSFAGSSTRPLGLRENRAASRNRSVRRPDRRSLLARTGGAGMGWGVWYICYEGRRKLRPK